MSLFNLTITILLFEYTITLMNAHRAVRVYTYFVIAAFHQYFFRSIIISLVNKDV
jgi:hypothetical protein